MSVTVLNDTNFFINTSLSAAINYDWRNGVGPKRYVVMHKGLVDTLNVRWFDGEGSLYENSGIEIATFALGAVIGVVAFGVSVVAVLATGGAAAAPIGVLLGVGGAYLGAGGLAIGGLSYAARDFLSTPASVTGVSVPSNRIFIVEGERSATVKKDGVLEIRTTKALSIRELSREEFSRVIAQEGWAEYRQDQQETTPIEDTYYSGQRKAVTGPSAEFLTAPEIIENDLFGGPVWIYSSYSGVPDVLPASWTPQADREGEPVLLWNDKRPASEWMIVPVDKQKVEVKAYNPKTVDPNKTNFAVQAYNIYNPALDMYACVSNNPDDSNIRLKKHPEPGSDAAKQHFTTDRYSLFFMIKSLNCWVFVPISRQTREVGKAIHLPALNNQDGNTGNGTMVMVGDRTGPHPGWARWVVERCSLASSPALMQRQIEALADKSPLGEKLIDQRVRIFPAIARRHLLPLAEFPVCWEIEGGSLEEGALIQLASRNDSKAEWIIQKRGYTGLDAFSFYCPALQRYAMVRDGYLRATKDSTKGVVAEFLIKYSMGFLSFVSLGQGVHGDLWVDGFGGGTKLRVGGLPLKEQARNRWQVISTASEVAKLEKWES